MTLVSLSSSQMRCFLVIVALLCVVSAVTGESRLTEPSWGWMKVKVKFPLSRYLGSTVVPKRALIDHAGNGGIEAGVMLRGSPSRKLLQNSDRKCKAQSSSEPPGKSNLFVELC
uniref:Predicted protein n=1 Tax=Physcomitrium patens TaxID=3218 RepID=A9U4E5_PHYPA